MFENSQTSERFRRYRRPPLLAASCVVLLLCGAARARDVAFPKDHPRVSLDVPDGWTMETTPTGLEIQSPEKDSIVLLQVVGRQKAEVEAWTKEAGAKFKAFGVTFAKDGGAAATTPAPAPPATAAPASSTAAPAAAASGAGPTKPAVVSSGTPAVPTLATGARAPDAVPSPTETATAAPKSDEPKSDEPKSGDSFTFSGAPSLSVPGTAGSNDPIKPGALSLEALTAPSPKAGSSRLSFKTVAFFGTSMHGKPVDAELAIYTLSKDRVLLLMQESRPEDNRSVAIGRSVRRAKSP